MVIVCVRGFERCGGKMCEFMVQFMVQIALRWNLWMLMMPVHPQGYYVRS